MRSEGNSLEVSKRERPSFYRLPITVLLFCKSILLRLTGFRIFERDNIKLGKSFKVTFQTLQTALTCRGTVNGLKGLEPFHGKILVPDDRQHQLMRFVFSSTLQASLFITTSLLKFRDDCVKAFEWKALDNIGAVVGQWVLEHDNALPVIQPLPFAWFGLCLSPAPEGRQRFDRIEEVRG